MTETIAAPAATALDLDTLEATALAASAMAPGPWIWPGNSDYEEPALSCIVPSLGRVEVHGHVAVDRVRDSFEVRKYMRSYRDCFMVTDEDADEELERWLRADPDYEAPNTDPRLSVTDKHNLKQPVRTWLSTRWPATGACLMTPRAPTKGSTWATSSTSAAPSPSTVRHPAPRPCLALIECIRGLEAQVADAVTA